MILDRILADKKIEVETRRASTSLDQLKDASDVADAPRDFAGALRSESITTQSDVRSPRTAIRLLAEVKKASPSKGLIRPDFNPVEIAQTYERSGASAISVLTDEKYFQGCADYLKAVHAAVELPIIRKDFIVDPYQIYEARSWSADAILLIVAALSQEQLSEYKAVADSLGMASLVEVHTADELDTALAIGAEIIGVNNRNLQTFETTVQTSLDLASKVPADRIMVSESGIFTRGDVERLMQAGFDAILVGESLMREIDPGVKVKELLGIG